MRGERLVEELNRRQPSVSAVPELDLHIHLYRNTIYSGIWYGYDIISRMGKSLSPSGYQALAEFRYQIRCFLHFSEQASRKAGLEPRQHQLMLALKGLPPDVRPRVGELAERLKIQHHSTVELANRLATGGYIRRRRGGTDRREVLLSLTTKGEHVLRELSLHHRAELRMQGPALLNALMRVMQPSKKKSDSNERTRKQPPLRPKRRIP